MPEGHTGRFVNACASWILPMAPSHTHSQIRRMPSPEWPWLPIWLMTPCLRAVSVSRRASDTEWVRGFWT